MKKAIFFLLMTTVALGLKAQQAPLFFHNQAERLTYRMDNPDGFPLRPAAQLRAVNEYHQKLDSVIGSDDFDWSRWKNVYEYTDSTTVEISYEWQNQAWIPTTMTETFSETRQTNLHRWTESGWELYSVVTYQYLTCGDSQLVESMTVETLQDSAWAFTSHATYEYDDNCNLVLNMNYRGQNEEGEWIENSKYEYSYDEEGRWIHRSYSTIRNGSWRESAIDSLAYDEQGLCVSLTSYRKGGWGPGSNVWRVGSKYEFDYVDGQLSSETLYASGWSGSDLTLDSKSEYELDANGNLTAKTASVFNEVDWMVRDQYENTFDNTVDAATVLGLNEVWDNMISQGMGYALGNEMPLNNQWLTCAIASSSLDTEFTLYCSGFAAVNEQGIERLKAYNHHGSLVVESPEPANIAVYDITGRVVASKPQTTQCTLNLKPGLYVVGNGNQFVKISIY